MQVIFKNRYNQILYKKQNISEQFNTIQFFRKQKADQETMQLTKKAVICQFVLKLATIKKIFLPFPSNNQSKK